MVSPMPPNGHSTANSKVSAGGSGHSHSPNPLKPSSRPCMPLLPGDQDSNGPAGGSPEGGVLRRCCSMVVAFAPSAYRTPSRSSLSGSRPPRDPRRPPCTEVRRSHHSSSDNVPCRETTSTSSMQPERKARIVGTSTTTFALRAAVRSTASTAPVSSAGGPDHGGSSGNPPGAGSSPAGNGSKNMTSRDAARPQTAQMQPSADRPTRGLGPHHPRPPGGLGALRGGG